MKGIVAGALTVTVPPMPGVESERKATLWPLRDQTPTMVTGPSGIVKLAALASVMVTGVVAPVSV